MQKPSLGYLHVVANWVLADSHGDRCVPTWKLVTGSIYRCSYSARKHATLVQANQSGSTEYFKGHSPETLTLSTYYGGLVVKLLIYLRVLLKSSFQLMVL